MQSWHNSFKVYLFILIPLLAVDQAASLKWPFIRLSKSRDTGKTDLQIQAAQTVQNNLQIGPEYDHQVHDQSTNYVNITEPTVSDSIDHSWTLDKPINIYYFSSTGESVNISINSNYSVLDDVFVADRPCVFIVHGWMSSHLPNDWMDRLKMVVFGSEPEANVFLVSWKYYSDRFNYDKSAASTKLVGTSVGHLIRYLIQFNHLDPQRVHLIGHSLGAHISGFVGKYLKAFNFEIARITALDPAGRKFQDKDATDRLDISDARFVQVIHSNIGNGIQTGLGMWQRMGHVDVYLNGGSNQPGCIAMSNGLAHDDAFSHKYDQQNLENKQKPRHKLKSYAWAYLSVNRYMQYLYCHHARSRRFFEMWLNQNCQAVAYQCSSYKDFLNGACTSCGSNGEQCFMASYVKEQDARKMMNVERNLTQSYFVNSRDHLPLCINHYHLRLKLNEKSNSTNRIIQITLHDYQRNSRLLEFNGDFEAGHTYDFLVTTDYFDPNQIEVVVGKYLNSITDHIWDQEALIVDSLQINFMSHMDRKIRKEKSVMFKFIAFEIDSSYLLQADKIREDNIF